MLERWRAAYYAMAADAVENGLPPSAVPLLPTTADADALRAARDHLSGMIASFTSACL